MADDVDPRFEPEFQRGYDPVLHGRPRPRPRQPAALAPAPVVVVEPEAPDGIEAADEYVPAVRRNPFLVALPILGAALLGTCAFLMVRWTGAYGRVFNAPGQADDTDWMFAGAAVSPALLVGGLVCITLWLTMLALIPRRADA
jgi:hypothetical protein